MADDIQEKRLQNFLQAEEKALRSQEYTVNGRTVRRADLGQIGKGIDSMLANGVGSDNLPGSRTKKVILMDY